jgi:ubiquinone/menaquinone biosynthesis C-methylase UbiE
MSTGDRVADYDSIADKYDRRYHLHTYAGVKEALLNFLGAESVAALEVGCGTGHWLAEIRKVTASAPRLFLAGVEPAAGMLARAREAAPAARLVRARAEALPWRDGTFDRVVCINALHHFTDRVTFFAEARRILKPGGALMSIGKDPHADRDSWWVYDYFPETIAIDRERFARVRILRGEIAKAGFDWTESFEVDRIEALTPAGDGLATGVVDRAYTSQLTVLSDEEFEAGTARIRAANAAAGGQLDLVTDFRLYATVGWTGESRIPNP